FCILIENLKTASIITLDINFLNLYIKSNSKKNLLGNLSERCEAFNILLMANVEFGIFNVELKVKSVNDMLLILKEN
ncbi:MAG: hypothetical protein M0Q02_09095, partial [Candidatus Muirbacterium halophilum]|nr:hypothetical protein [Candidatus Muirbacterium halophilum]